MPRILVSGLINIEVTVRVEAFPIQYTPVRYPFHEIDSGVSGVGYNVAKALTVLGDQVDFLSLSGRDLAGQLARQTLEEEGVSSSWVRADLDQTPYSVILYDREGKRQINVDLKDIQEKDYPLEESLDLIQACDLAALCNINFSRALIPPARRAGKWIATDVHAISNLEDDYNRDFMAAAQILFMSDEGLPERPEAWAHRVLNRYGNEILAIGLGEQGVLLAVKPDGFMERFPAQAARQVVNTIGAGDALFSSFLHFFSRTRDPYLSIGKAQLFAAYKIGSRGAAQGFLTEMEVDALWDEQQRN